MKFIATDVDDSPQKLQRAIAEQLEKPGFGIDRYFYRSTPNGARIGCRKSLCWHGEKLIPSVSVDPSRFDTDLHRSAAAAGATLIRIEVPGSNTNFACHSIWRTATKATADRPFLCFSPPMRRTI